MKIKQSIKTFSLISTAALFPLAVMATPQGLLNDWSVTAGTGTMAGKAKITGNCPASQAASCTTLVVDDGILQQQVEDATGKTYIRTIITDTGAGVSGDPAGTSGSLGYFEENFIDNTSASAGGSTAGLLGRQAIHESTASASGTNNFDNTTDIAMGWADPLSNSGGQVVFFNSFNDSGSTVSADDDFSTSFKSTVLLDASGAQTSNSTDIDMQVNMGTADSGLLDTQIFGLRLRSGTANSSDVAGAPTNLTLGAGDGDPALYGGTVALNTAAASGDAIQVAYFGQRIGVGGSLGDQVFITEIVENKTAGNKVATFENTISVPTSLDGSTAPAGGVASAQFQWNAVFGPTAPVLP